MGTVVDDYRCFSITRLLHISRCLIIVWLLSRSSPLFLILLLPHKQTPVTHFYRLLVRCGLPRISLQFPELQSSSVSVGQASQIGAHIRDQVNARWLIRKAFEPTMVCRIVYSIVLFRLSITIPTHGIHPYTLWFLGGENRAHAGM